MVAEERNLLVLADPAGNGGLGGVTPPLQGRGDYYLDHYSITRLRRLAEAPLSGPQRFDDLYLSLRTLFQVLRDETQAPALGVPALNGELFDVSRTRHLEAAYLNNRDLLSAIRQLSYFTPEKEQVRRRVNYGALDVEELGSVYESLLDEYPVISSPPGGRPRFAFVQGTERKTTGSYYTARELVKETLDSALDPVIAERLKAAAESLRRSDPAAAAKVRQAQIAALLAIRVCDSACGSGHFLLASARRIGRALAQVATGEDEPSPEAVRHWTREAIIHCIYGVDKNPLAVDLCKVALWIEGFSEGKPLTFLDAHIKCGDSLVGVFDLKVLDAGIPDEAFEPVTGDDKAVARGAEAAQQARSGTANWAWSSRKSRPRSTRPCASGRPSSTARKTRRPRCARSSAAYRKLQAAGGRPAHRLRPVDGRLLHPADRRERRRGRHPDHRDAAGLPPPARRGRSPRRRPRRALARAQPVLPLAAGVPARVRGRRLHRDAGQPTVGDASAGGAGVLRRARSRRLPPQPTMAARRG